MHPLRGGATGATLQRSDWGPLQLERCSVQRGDCNGCNGEGDPSPLTASPANFSTLGMPKLTARPPCILHGLSSAGPASKSPVQSHRRAKAGRRQNAPAPPLRRPWTAIAGRGGGSNGAFTLAVPGEAPRCNPSRVLSSLRPTWTFCPRQAGSYALCVTQRDGFHGHDPHRGFLSLHHSG